VTSRNSSAGRVPRCGMQGPWFDVWHDRVIFSSPKPTRHHPGPYSTSTKGLLLSGGGVKWPGRGVDDYSPSGTKVKMGGAISLLLVIVSAFTA
jgi:hypothetical protein